jgi:hypothetical protein
MDGAPPSPVGDDECEPAQKNRTGSGSMRFNDVTLPDGESDQKIKASSFFPHIMRIKQILGHLSFPGRFSLILVL